MGNLMGIDQVSGFYGPGAWTAWYLTLLASWVAVIRGDYTHNVHHIGHMLYTSWASFDLYRQALSLSGETPMSNGRRGRMAAAFAVTFWGQFHGVAQLLFCFYENRRERPQSPSPADIRRRIRILLCGLDLPSLLILSFLNKNFLKSSEQTGSTVDSLIPALYFDGITPEQHHVVLLLTSSLMAAQGLIIHCLVGLMISRLFMLHQPLGPAALRLVKRAIAILFGLSFLVQLYGITRYFIRLMATSGEVFQESCYFMPCAPQSIGEVDQAFAVFFALFMVVYELGPEVAISKVADSDWWYRITTRSEDMDVQAGSLLL
ncbi:hypothetical protein BKA66DRAFT_436312 [Pyrenochaeta sp. MPI-SDFR-AT-0127]|nr:hypothetical protein BKA66DRAFT_436312 [Pyrenochaeta sp. MPI-SDFR-AT-0127]